MKHSESIKEIASALAKAQINIKAAVKDSTNPHFRSKYADIASVIEAIREPLNKQGISFLQPVSSSDRGVVVETILIHSSGEWISECLDMPVGKQDAQGVGSAITYGRRYGLMSMCGVPAEDDDGNAATSARKNTPDDGKINPVDKAGYIASIDAAKHADELAAIWKKIAPACRDAKDMDAYNELKGMVSVRGSELKAAI